MNKIEWVSCSERLPTEDKMYLVSVRDPDFFDNHPIGVTIACWNTGTWFKNTTWDIYAWSELPLPAEYHEEDDDAIGRHWPYVQLLREK